VLQRDVAVDEEVGQLVLDQHLRRDPRRAVHDHQRLQEQLGVEADDAVLEEGLEVTFPLEKHDRDPPCRTVPPGTSRCARAPR
jgi:hypothetical protein